MMPPFFASFSVWKARKVAAVLLACVLLSTFSIAQNDTPETTASHELNGTVVNSMTGEPVRRALVQITGTSGMQSSALTDSEGRFQFTSIPDTEVQVVARKPGFFNDLELHLSQGFHAADITRLSGDAQPLVLKLVPENVVTGHVTTLKGEPIEDCPVRILRQTIVDGRRTWALQGQAMSDEDGAFRIGNLFPGKYLVSAGPSVGTSEFTRGRSARRQEGFPTIYYPGVAEMESATPLVLAGGQQMQADFALKPEPLFKVSGHVIGLTPGMSAGLQFVTKSGEPLPFPINFHRPLGEFDAAVPGGNYVLQFRGYDSNGHSTAADLALVVNGDVEGVSLVLTRFNTWPVIVEPRPSGTSRENALASAAVGHMQFVSSVRLVSSEGRQDAPEFQAEVNDKGIFAFRNLVPGRYSVEVAALAPWYVRSLTSGTTDLMREDLIVVPGHLPEPLQVVLRDDSCSLKGLVRADGQPAAGAVLLFPDQGSLTHVQASSAAAGSEFYFAGLAPGDYKLLAVDSLEDLEFRNPEALAPYLSKAVSVSLQANEVATLNVERVSTGKQP